MLACTLSSTVRPLSRIPNGTALPSMRRGLAVTKPLSKSSTEQQPAPSPDETITQAAQDAAARQTTTKTQAQLDEETMQKLATMSGEGGEAGIEYEDGKPVSMKRNVKEQMFRIMPVRGGVRG